MPKRPTRRQRFPDSDLFAVPQREERRAALIHQWDREEEKRLIEEERIVGTALTLRQPNPDTSYGQLLDELHASLVPDREAARWIALKRLWLMLHPGQWKEEQGEMPTNLWEEMLELESSRRG